MSQQNKKSNKKKKSSMSNSDQIKDFIVNYIGALIGGFVAILLLATGFNRFLVVVVIIAAGVWLGNYFLHHKEEVKEKLRRFIDRL